MPPTLHYPDLTPPAGWTYVRQGSQIRLAPPGTPHALATAAIIVSPLLARHERLPPPAELIAMAITVEEKNSLQISRRLGPMATKTDSGLQGIYFEIWGFTGPNRPEEHRLYVLFADALCYYGINYVASVAAFAEHEATFWATARSIQPFRGRVAPPATVSNGNSAPQPAGATGATGTPGTTETAGTTGTAGATGTAGTTSTRGGDRGPGTNEGAGAVPPTGYED